MSAQDAPELLNKFILQVRYKPNARVLDYRGAWVEKISAHLQLSEWNIVENRVDIYSKNGQNRAFVSFTDCGFVTNDVPSREYFSDQATRLIKYLLGLEGFDAPLFVNRIGVRSTFYRPFNGKFEDLLGKYAGRFLNVSEKVHGIMAAQVVDIGGPIYFKGDRCNFNTMSGPMKADQARIFLERSDKLPDLGLYFDIDYWKKPLQVIPNNDIFDFINRSSKESWEKYDKVVELVFSD